jgi:hypothetical protein
VVECRSSAFGNVPHFGTVNQARFSCKMKIFEECFLLGFISTWPIPCSIKETACPIPSCCCMFRAGLKLLISLALIVHLNDIIILSYQSCVSLLNFKIALADNL